MAILLELLYDEYDQADAIQLLRDDSLRSGAMTELAPKLEACGMAAGLLETDIGRNLFVAVLTLRLRFPIEEARQKVQLNIAMREGRA